MFKRIIFALLLTAMLTTLAPQPTQAQIYMPKCYATIKGVKNGYPLGQYVVKVAGLVTEELGCIRDGLLGPAVWKSGTNGLQGNHITINGHPLIPVQIVPVP